jgi:cell division protein FtsQ
MTRHRAAMRPGARWQPVPPRGPKQRFAGRQRLRLPGLRLPHWEVRWRRFVVPLLIVALAAFGGWWFYRSSALSIHSVSVKGNSVLPAEGLRQVAGLKGQSLFNPDLDAARQRLLALPLVKAAHVSRDWPFGVQITIAERAPWGVWQAGDQRYVIDDEGVVLSLPAPDGAPLIAQTDPPAMLSPGDRVDVGAVEVAKQLVATSQQTLGRSVTGLEFSQSTGLTVVLDGDLRVAFGDAQGYDFKVATLFALLQQGRDLHSVDLRFGSLVAVE